MEVIVLIVTILGLIPVYFLIKAKLRKRYEFDLDYRNITFARFSYPQNPKLDGRLCLVLYMLRVVNKSDEPSTLKNVFLSYQYDGKHYQDESYVVPTGMLPKTGKPAIILSNGIDNVVLMGWHNVRSKLGEHETLQSGGVFHGSAVFLFESHITDTHCIQDLTLVVNDFSRNKTVHPITIEEDWFSLLNKGFAVMRRPFTIGEDDSVQWV